MAADIRPLPAASTLRIVADVLAPLIARGLIVRRPRVVDFLAGRDLDRRAIARLRAVREHSGQDLVVLRLPGRRLAIPLTPEAARAALAAEPATLSPANREKRAALARFEPRGVLISSAAERPARRRLNEQALAIGQPVHPLGAAIEGKVQSEAAWLVGMAGASGALRWIDFDRACCRIGRRVILGDAAASDERLSGDLARLRRDANWGYLMPVRRRRRAALLARLARYANAAESGSIVGHMAGIQGAAQPQLAAVEQIPQWLFAFDAVPMAAFAALALLCTHRAAMATATAQAATAQAAGTQAAAAQASTAQASTAQPAAAQAAGGEPVPRLPYLRACVLESLRLWPTTPAILRDGGMPTEWRAGRLPAGCAVLVFTPLLHRDERLRPDAERFVPERWLEGDGADVVEEPDSPVPLVPFSGGATRCPGRELVLAVASQLLAAVLRGGAVQLHGDAAWRLAGDRPLPATLSPFGLRFDFTAAVRG